MIGVARAQSEPGAVALIQSANAQYAEIWMRAFERGDLSDPVDGQQAVAVFNRSIPGVVASGAAIELIDADVGFTEGPVGTPDGGLFFSAVMANRIYRLEPSGEVRVFLENSNGANGLVLQDSGTLLAVRNDGVIRISRTGDVTSVVSETDRGTPFLRPNDLIADARGGVYFTDPGPRPIVPGRNVYVYYKPPEASQVLPIDDSIVRPNGIALSLDGNTLFANDSMGDTVYAYSVLADGSVVDKRPFAALQNIPEGGVSGADGMVIDQSDRLYVTTDTGVQIFDSEGQYLGTIAVPNRPTNVAFSGPGKSTLYITTFDGVYRLDTVTQGLARTGK